MDKSALCQDYAAGPSSGWGPAAPGQPHRDSLSCIEVSIDVLYSNPPEGRWHAALGTTGTTGNPCLLSYMIHHLAPMDKSALCQGYAADPNSGSD